MSTGSVTRTTRQSWVLFVALVLAIGCMVGTGLIALKEVGDNRDLTRQNAATSSALRQDIGCITAWFDTYVQGQQSLRTVSTARADALDALVRLLNNPNVTRAQWNTLLHQYDIASDNYNTTIARNPVPSAPKLACG